ncbi:MAG: dipeptidase [Phycisphaerales bacterium]
MDTPLYWFDAHLDLAYMAENGRAMEEPLERCGGPDLPAAVSFPSLHEGGVRRCLATIFTEAGGPPQQPQSYPPDDIEAANLAGRRQLKRYSDWHRPHFYAALSSLPSQPQPREAPDFLVLIEGADVILDPADLGEWREAGVVAIGLTWWKPGRAAGGNGTDLGLTDFGRALVKEIDRLGIVHDASHLSDRGFFELLDASNGPIMASHSNCRALAGGGGRGENQRHLHDEQIRAITARGGVIGLNLFSRFLRPGLDGQDPARATIADCVAHIEHICAIAGSRGHIGLGSDMDGGFSADRLPEGINTPRDLHLLAEALHVRGWSDHEIHGFAHSNFERFFGLRPCPA